MSKSFSGLPRTYGMYTFDFSEKFQNLISSPGVKYALFPEHKDQFKDKAGIYHFFSVDEIRTKSLYVGKAGFAKGDWDLYKRVSQHFQPSQEKTIHGHIAKEFGTTSDKVIEFLKSSNLYVQYIALFEKGNEQEYPDEELENMIKSFENFCKSCLNPTYTDL